MKPSVTKCTDGIGNPDPWRSYPEDPLAKVNTGRRLIAASQRGDRLTISADWGISHEFLLAKALDVIKDLTKRGE